MNEPPPLPETPAPAASSQPPMSLAGRLVNVFAVPGEVFDDAKVAKSTATNWLVPALLACVVGVVSALIMFSQPTIQQQLREQQEKAMKPELDKQVAAGKMTQAQADQAIEMMEKFTGPTMMKIIGSVGAVFASFARVFWWGLILWLLGRWILKSQFDYMKSVEIAGLASMIAVLGAIVSLLLIVNLGKLFSTPSLALAVSDFDVKNKGHLLMGAVNVFTFWQLVVMAIGLGRLTSVPFARAVLPVFGFWIVWTVVMVLCGMGQFVL